MPKHYGFAVSVSDVSPKTFYESTQGAEEPILAATPNPESAKVHLTSFCTYTLRVLYCTIRVHCFNLYSVEHFLFKLKLKYPSFT